MASAAAKNNVLMFVDFHKRYDPGHSFENGSAFTVDAAWILPDSFTAVVNQQIRVVGSEGIVEVDSQDRGLMAAYTSRPSAVQANPFGKLEAPDDVFGGTRMRGYIFDSMMHFPKLLKLIKEGMPLEKLRGLYPAGEEAVVSAIMCEAAHESMATGKVVSLSL